MGKYTFLGFFLIIALMLITGFVVNHSSNTVNMQEIDTGIQTAVLGTMRDNADTNAYGMRAKDVVATITKEVADRQTDSKKTVVIDYKFYSDEEGKTPIAYNTAITNNSVVKSVQYRVKLYNTKDLNADYTIKSGAQAESTTENRIVLNKAD